MRLKQRGGVRGFTQRKARLITHNYAPTIIPLACLQELLATDMKIHTELPPHILKIRNLTNSQGYQSVFDMKRSTSPQSSLGLIGEKGTLGLLAAASTQGLIRSMHLIITIKESTGKYRRWPQKMMR
jgi:hypothetical protein